MKSLNLKEILTDKRTILIVIALVCFFFYFYGSKNVPYLDKLAMFGGLAYAVSNLANLAK